MKKCILCGKELQDDEVNELRILPPEGDEPLEVVYMCETCFEKVRPVISDEKAFNSYLRESLEDIKNNWEKGTKENSKVDSIVKILELKDEKNNTYCGKTGVITKIDDIGQLWGTWGGLAIIPEVDKYLVFKGESDGKEN